MAKPDIAEQRFEEWSQGLEADRFRYLCALEDARLLVRTGATRDAILIVLNKALASPSTAPFYGAKWAANGIAGTAHACPPPPDNPTREEAIAALRKIRAEVDALAKLPVGNVTFAAIRNAMNGILRHVLTTLPSGDLTNAGTDV